VYGKSINPTFSEWGSNGVDVLNCTISLISCRTLNNPENLIPVLTPRLRGWGSDLNDDGLTLTVHFSDIDSPLNWEVFSDRPVLTYTECWFLRIVVKFRL